MPRILQKPGQQQRVTLSLEDHKPEGDRIVWVGRVLSRTELIDYEEECERIIRLPYKEQVEPMGKLLRRVAVGWENIVDEQGQPLAFDDAALSIFTPQELIAIARELPEAAAWGAVRPKKSSPLPLPAV